MIEPYTPKLQHFTESKSYKNQKHPTLPINRSDHGHSTNFIKATSNQKWTTTKNKQPILPPYHAKRASFSSERLQPCNHRRGHSGSVDAVAAGSRWKNTVSEARWVMTVRKRFNGLDFLVLFICPIYPPPNRTVVSFNLSNQSESAIGKNRPIWSVFWIGNSPFYACVPYYGSFTALGLSQPFLILILLYDIKIVL